MSLARAVTGLRNSVTNFLASSRISMTLFNRAKSGARGNDATNRDTKPNWITVERHRTKPTKTKTIIICFCYIQLKLIHCVMGRTVVDPWNFYSTGENTQRKNLNTETRWEDSFSKTCCFVIFLINPTLWIFCSLRSWNSFKLPLETLK